MGRDVEGCEGFILIDRRVWAVQTRCFEKRGSYVLSLKKSGSAHGACMWLLLSPSSRLRVGRSVKMHCIHRKRMHSFRTFKR